MEGIRNNVDNIVCALDDPGKCDLSDMSVT